MESDDGNKQKIVENDKTAAEDMRKQALESMLKERREVMNQTLQKRRVARAQWTLLSI